MKEIHYITPAIAPISESEPGGRCIERWFYESGGSVILCTEEGQPILNSFGGPWRKALAPGDDPRKVATNLALAHWRSARDFHSEFNRPLTAKDYPMRGWR
jgi:hypothetical protein